MDRPLRMVVVRQALVDWQKTEFARKAAEPLRSVAA
jgi:hypothetical protein